MRKFVATVAAAGTLAAGGVTAAVLNPFQGAGAQTAPPTTAAPNPADPGAQAKSGKADAVSKILDDLVTKGTITHQQRDAIVEAFKAHRGELRHGSFRHMLANRKELGAVVAKTLGTTPQDLQAQLKAGKSIADVAKDKGVDLKVVTDAVNGELTARVDKALANGKLEQAKADAFKAKLPQVVDKLVNHKR